MKSIQSKDKEIEDLLDSDDELPCDYIETPYVPAYKNDDRFKTVQFNWKSIVKKNEKLQSTSNNMVKSQINDRVLKKGILNKNDIFLLKCIEKSDNTTLLWFVNFLLRKDLQSNYMFLTSCLVPNIQYDCYNRSGSAKPAENKERQRYKVIVL